MLPTVFEAGGVAVPTYFITTCLGYTLGFLWLHRAAGRLLSDADRLVGLYMSLMVTGWLGARLMHIVGGLGHLQLADILSALGTPGGGVAFLGGVFGGTVGAVVYMVFARLPVWKLLDVAAPALMAGLAVGRVGCSMAGCCHGREIDAPVAAVLGSLPGGDVVALETLPFLAVVYRPLGHGSVFGVPVFPTQLYEVVLAATIALGLHWMYRRWRRFDGQIFAAMLLIYGTGRWGSEQLRGDVVRGVSHELGGAVFSTGELSGLVLFALASGIVVARGWRPLGREPVPMRVPLPESPDVDHSGLLD